MACAGSPPSGQSGVRRAVGGVGVERLLEARVLVHVAVGGALGGVHRAVEHHRAHVAGELLGVERAEERAVGVAEERELGVAEGGAQHVHVAGGVAGADVRQHAVAAGALRAPTRVLAVLRLGLGDPGRRRVDVEVGPLGDPFRVGEAVDRRGARADAARVEPDEVEPLAERAVGELRTERRHHAEPGRAGATGVEQQRADALAGGLLAQHGDARRRAVGRRVIQRHLQAGALEGVGGERRDVADGAGERLARTPGELLAVEARELGRGWIAVASAGAARRWGRCKR